MNNVLRHAKKILKPHNRFPQNVSITLISPVMFHLWGLCLKKCTHLQLQFRRIQRAGRNTNIFEFKNLLCKLFGFSHVCLLVILSTTEGLAHLPNCTCNKCNPDNISSVIPEAQYVIDAEEAEKPIESSPGDHVETNSSALTAGHAMENCITSSINTPTPKQD